MKKIKGNLLDMFDNHEFDMIVHGCNCHHNMSGGIAAQIAKRYPAALEADLDTTYGDKRKLGTIRIARINYRQEIINAYTQFYPGADARLKAIRLAMREVNELAKMWPGVKVGIPAIGCGIGGLKLEHLEPVVDLECKDTNITLVEFG